MDDDPDPDSDRNGGIAGGPTELYGKYYPIEEDRYMVRLEGKHFSTKTLRSLKQLAGIEAHSFSLGSHFSPFGEGEDYLSSEGCVPVKLDGESYINFRTNSETEARRILEEIANSEDFTSENIKLKKKREPIIT